MLRHDAVFLFSKWFEPRSISSIVIVRVSVVLKRSVGGSLFIIDMIDDDDD